MPSRPKNKFADKEPSVELTWFTPDFAREALGLEEDKEGLIKIGKTRYTAKNNKANRPLRPAMAKTYCQAMLAGEWHFTGDSMTFDTSGRAVSLQHRCIAILLAEEEIRKQPQKYRNVKLEYPQVVAYGVKPKSADYADRGVTRNAGDVIFRHGTFKDLTVQQAKKCSSDMGTAQRLIWTRLKGRWVKGSGKQHHTEVLETLKQHPKLEEAVRYIVELDSAEHNAEKEETRAAGGISHKLSRSYAAALLYLFAAAHDDREEWEQGKDPQFGLWVEACEFFRQLAEPYELPKGSPVIALIKRREAMQKAENTNRDEIVTAVIKAWNAWIAGEQITSANQLKISKDGGESVYEIIGGLDIGPFEEIVAGDEEPEPEEETEA